MIIESYFIIFEKRLLGGSNRIKAYEMFGNEIYRTEEDALSELKEKKLNEEDYEIELIFLSSKEGE